MDMADVSFVQTIQKRLVENITLLWTLCETPGQPKTNKINEGHDEGRQLSRERERQLVDSFAFISATTDNPLRVMAVCMEEDDDKIGLTIRLASNTGDLGLVTQGFNEIARSLEHASMRKKSRNEMQQEVFRQIVTLDESRILARLRSSHAPKSEKTRGKIKPELMASLNGAILDKSISGRDETAKALIGRIRLSSKSLSQKFSEFENIRGNPDNNNASRDMLMDVVRRIEGFDVDGLEKVLKMSRLIDPSLRDHLPQAMSKIGRYFRIACDLIEAARNPKYTLFRRISVQALGTPHFDTKFLTKHTPTFDQTARRVTGSSYRRLIDDYDSASVAKAQKKFESRMSNCPIPWKVHAEIQLLLFYEQQPQTSRPRIIGSSKSACYLCNLFVQLHGEYCIPRTHGRLWDRWMLPGNSIYRHAPNTHLVSVIDRLNAALEAKIVQTLRHRARPPPHPNESVLFIRQPWSPTPTLSESHEQGSIRGLLDSSCESSTEDQKFSPSVISSRSLPQPVQFNSPNAEHNQIPDERLEPGDLIQGKLSRGQIKTQSNTSIHSAKPSTALSHPIYQSPLTGTPNPQDQSQTQQPDTEPPKPDRCPPNLDPTVRHLPPGDSTTHKLNDPQDILTIEAGPITIHASRSSNSSPLNLDLPSPNPCWIHIQWLTSESSNAHDASKYESIDLASLATDRDTIVGSGAAMSSKGLALRCGGHVVLVKFAFEDAESMQAKG